MSENRLSVLWPTPEAYERYRAVCDDALPDTFVEFASEAEERIRTLGAAGLQVRRLAFDPETMGEWCRATCGRVDENARRLYAAYLSTKDEVVR